MFFDRVKETSVTTGSGSFTLDGAVTSFQSFSIIGSGNVCYYAAEINSLGEWELGSGYYEPNPSRLSRGGIISSSQGGNIVNFSAGAKTIFLNHPARMSNYILAQYHSMCGGL
jgi:hypothetical protein